MISQDFAFIQILILHLICNNIRSSHWYAGLGPLLTIKPYFKRFTQKRQLLYFLGIKAHFLPPEHGSLK